MAGTYLRQRTTLLLAASLLGFTTTARAHTGALGSAVESATVPTWLTIVTGGALVGGSFLFTSLLTDHEAIRQVNGWRIRIAVGARARTAFMRIAQIGSLAVLGLVLVAGVVGPQQSTTNFAILLVWAVWWAGFTMSVYLVGNSWPALNPWRALLPSAGERSYPDRFGAWPSVAGLLLLVWIEVVSPLSEQPRLLVAAIAIYSVVTIAGALVYGADAWFDYVDPVSRVFRYYGQFAPVQRGDDGLELALPSVSLVRPTATGTGETGFVIALLWATTYDGLVSTPPWVGFAEVVVDLGVPPRLLYLLGIVAGFVGFYAIYRLASRYARDTADTYVTSSTIRGWFVTSLIPIAAGYHLAHFAGYFLALLPAIAAAAAAPFSAVGSVPLLALPEWFGLLQLGFVLLGHLLAVWVAHALAFELFPGTLQPIRSQYPFIIVMVFYTMTSLWIITQPYTTAGFL